MKRMRILGLLLIAAAATSAVLAASASAEPGEEQKFKNLPEIGRCVPSAPLQGEYKNRFCVYGANGKGRNNWQPGPGAKKKFLGTAVEAVILETVKGRRIECSTIVFEGEYTGPKTLKTKVDLVGCLEQASKKTCQSNPNPMKKGEIEFEAEGGIGFIKSGEKPAVGVDLKIPALTVFECGELLEAVHYEMSGSFIGQATPLNIMSPSFKLAFKVKSGKQIPQMFEGAPKDTITLTHLSGLEKVSEEAGLRALVEVENEEQLEIKASYIPHP